MKSPAGFVFCLALVLLGCGGQMAQAPLGDPQATPAESSANASYESIWKEQKLIRNGRIQIEVGDVEQAATLVSEIASRHDGILADSQTSRYASGAQYASIRVRVPASEFDATLTELRTLGTVTDEGVTTEDVTKEYFDLETRLAVKRKTAERLNEILSTRTGNLADVIAAETELGRVTAEIEQMEGEKRFYDHRIATSTIQVSLNEAGGVLSSVFDPIQEGFRHAGEALGQSVQAMILLVTVLIPWLAAAVSIWFMWRKVPRRPKRTSNPSPPAP